MADLLFATLVLDEFIPGASKSKGSMEHIGAGQMRESVAGSKLWRMLMAYQLRHAWAPRAPLAGPVQVDGWFYLPVASPQALVTKGARGNYDKDKLERNLFDAITDAAVWKDDAQAVDGRMVKAMATEQAPQGVHVLIWELTP